MAKILIFIGVIFLIVSFFLPIVLKLLWVWFEFVDEFIDDWMEYLAEKREKRHESHNDK